MRSNDDRLPRPRGKSGQSGVGLVEILVASAILGISLVVMLSNLSTMVVGARVADRRIVEERLASNQVELLMAEAPSCALAEAAAPITVDHAVYSVATVVRGRGVGGNLVDCASAHYLEYSVTATDPSGARVVITFGRYRP